MCDCGALLPLGPKKRRRTFVRFAVALAISYGIVANILTPYVQSAPTLAARFGDETVEFVASAFPKTIDVDGNPLEAIAIVHSMFADTVVASNCLTVGRYQITKRPFIAIRAGSKACRSLKVSSDGGRLLSALEELAGKITLRIVETGVYRSDDGIPLRVGPAPLGTPSALMRINGTLSILMLPPNSSYGSVPSELMDNGDSGSIDGGIVLAHELGHYFLKWRSGLEVNDRGAVEFENMVRRVRDPRAPMRVAHTGFPLRG